MGHGAGTDSQSRRPESGCINLVAKHEDILRGLKPAVLLVFCGTTEVVPFQSLFMQPFLVAVLGEMSGVADCDSEKLRMRGRDGGYEKEERDSGGEAATV
jgi:hypothetical protein